MKELVKAFNKEEEIQLANALCSEYQGCTGADCAMYCDDSGNVCQGFYKDTENQDDIIF